MASKTQRCTQIERHFFSLFLTSDEVTQDSIISALSGKRLPSGFFRLGIRELRLEVFLR